MKRDGKSASQRAGTPAPKTCATCGRTIEWRKKWERDWDNVKFCSDACRTHKPGARDKVLEDTILRLLRDRGAGTTICPSAAARAVAGGGTCSDDRAAWEPRKEDSGQEGREEGFLRKRVLARF